MVIIYSYLVSKLFIKRIFIKCLYEQDHKNAMKIYSKYKVIIDDNSLINKIFYYLFFTTINKTSLLYIFLCNNGHTYLASLLYNTCKSVVNHKEIYLDACKYNNLKTIKYLTRIDNTLLNNNYAYQVACHYNNANVLLYISKMNKDCCYKYYNGKFIPIIKENIICNDLCLICHEKCDSNIDCNHTYCYKCTKYALKDYCLICKKEITLIRRKKYTPDNKT